MTDTLDTAGAVRAYLTNETSPQQLGAQARYSMLNAVGTNTTFEAELRDVAKRTGVPVDTVRAYPEDMKKQATLGAYDFDKMAAEFPNTTRFLTDQDKAAVGHQSIETLKSLEGLAKRMMDGFAPEVDKTLGAPGVLTTAMFKDRIQKLMAQNPALDVDAARKLASNGVTLDNINPGIQESKRPETSLTNLVGGLGVGVRESMYKANQGLSRMSADILGFDDVAANAKRLSDQSDSRVFLGAPKPGGLGGMVYGGVQSTVQQLPGIAASVLVGNPAPALGSIFFGSAGGAYGKYRDRGGSVGQAVLGSTLEGGLEVATEFLPMKMVTEKIGKMGASAFAKEFFGKELAGEEINTVLSNAVDTAIANPNKTWGQYFAELPADMLETAVQTFVQTGLLSGASHVLSKTVQKAQAASYQSALAEQHATAIEGMQKTMQASEILKHSPDTLRTYAQDLADQGVSNVYVDSAQLIAAGVDLQALAQVVPSIAPQLEQADSGGDLVIPTGELLTNTIGTEYAQTLIDHARTDVQGMSRVEAKTYMQEKGDQINAEIERVMAEKEQDTEFKAGRDAVQAQVLQQLNDLKRFTPKVNEHYAALTANFYSVMAARTGMTVQAFADKYKLGFSGTNSEGGMYDQGDLMVTHNLTAENLLHAVKMGGIPVPSLAVTKKQNPLMSFGEVTLIGPSELVDPKGYAGTKVFGADIYSPRYPKVNYELTPAKMKPLIAEFQTGEKAAGMRIQWDEVQNRGPEELVNSPAVMWQFLTEQGITPDVTYEPAFDAARRERLRDFGFEKFFGNTNHQSLMRDDEFQRLVIAEKNAGYELVGMPDLVIDFDATKASDFSRIMALSRNTAYDMGKINRQTEPNGYATRDSLRAQIRGKFDDAFKSYVDGKFSALGAKERIFQGFTNSGNKKYIPHTLENVVKILKTQLRGGENFNYGVGSLRAKFTPQFKSLEQIRKNKDRLLDKAGFEKVKAEIDAEFETVLASFGRDMDSRTGIAILEDAAKMGVVRAGKTYGIDIGESAATQAAEFLTRLRELPTEYFEAKVLRDVDLTEFKGAVVPEGVDPKVIEALKARGVTDIRTYKKNDDVDRAATIGQFEHLFFQQARGQIAFGNDITQQASVISLLKGADLSTFIHEAGHFFLEVQSDLASRIEAAINAGESVSDSERAILTDMTRTLEWMGVKGEPGITALQQWTYMTADEKRSHHEQWARGFEAYAFEGKAPSLDLQHAFQTFRAWLVNVYRALLKSVNASKTDVAGAMKVELSDEVRSVMDRMLATSDQIAEAEAARNMGPMFQSAEQAGMDLEAYQAYHDMGTQATLDAVEQLQARGLRDMQWLQNARSRKLKELQKQHDALRTAITMQVRREVMGQPIYRAWTFLTARGDEKVVGDKPVGKATGLNPEVDNLFTAIAKLGGLDRAEVKKQWGIDEKEKMESGVFGAPVVRKTGGLSFDAMAERLLENGYLLPDENGKADIQKFEELFDDQRRGTDRYSISRDMAAAYGDAPLNLPVMAEVGFGKLRTQDLRERYGVADDAVWRKLSALRMTSDDGGLHPDVVAELFEFGSGDELVKTLAETEPPKSVIQGMVDTRMLQEHGDLATPAGLERAADAAIHNDARARFVATELRALQHAMAVREKVPGQKNSVDVLVRAAKDYAATVIARLKVRDIRPGQYAAAEVRAAKAAKKAIGDVAQATLHKRNQLINLYATKAAYAAQDEVKAAVQYFKKFDNTIKSLDPEYQGQIHALLERFDLRQGVSLKALDKRKSLVEWVQAQLEDGLTPDIPPELLQEANRKSFKDMTVEEVRGLRDTIKQIEHLGHLKNKLLTAQANRDFNAAVDDIAGGINLYAGDRQADTRTPNTWLGAKLVTLKNFGAEHIKVATWARVMDGGKDGGAVWEYLIRTANMAGDSEVVMREKATKALAKLVAPVLKEGKMGGKGEFFPSINRSLNKEAKLAIALNMGNESNAQRLLGGEEWTIQQIQPVLNSLSAADWQFVQAVWDYFETYRPAIGAKEKRVYGKEPVWVEATPVQTPFGELRGGYYPIKYDPRASERAESHADAEAIKLQLAGAYTSATTRRSFTKTRAEEVKGRPLLYSLDGIYNGVQEVIHDLAWHEWLIDANKLVKNKRIAEAMRSKYGPDVHQQFKKWLEDNAAGDRAAQGAAEKASAWLRQGVSVSGLGLNVMSALMQPLGITQSIVRVGPQWVGRGMAKFIGSPLETADTINAKSEFMRTRALTRLREINEVRNQVKGTTAVRQAIDTSAYFLMMRCQQAVDIPTWWGAYEKATAEGNDESRAVALADQAVIDAQGSGSTKDQSAIERGSPVAKLFTVFYSFFNTALNLGVQKTMTQDNKAKLAADYLLLYSLPVILGAAMKDALTSGDSGDWDDWEKIAKTLVREHLGFLMGTMVYVREFAPSLNALTGTEKFADGYRGPAGLRTITDSYKLSVQLQQGEADGALRKAIISTAGDLLRLPAAQINRTITGLEALRDGKTQNPGAILTGYQEAK
jgi:hypothetical protein